MKKVRAGKFDTSKFINSNVRDGQNANIGKLGNLYSGQAKLQGGERKAEKTEKPQEKDEEEDEEEVRAEKTEKTTEEEEEEDEEDEDEVKVEKPEKTTEEKEEGEEEDEVNSTNSTNSEGWS